MIFGITTESFSIVYMTQDEALHWALPGADEIRPEEHALTVKEKKEVEGRIGWELRRDRFLFYRGVTKGEILGYAFIDEEIGKYQPITFVVALNTDGSVRDVEMMVFRESVGSEIKGRRFLNQFQGKRASSPFKLGSDVDAITGATLSSRAANRVVKKAVILFEKFYLGGHI